MYKINRNHFIMFMKYLCFMKIDCQITTDNNKNIFWFPLFDDSGMRFSGKLYLNSIKSLKRMVF